MEYPAIKHSCELAVKTVPYRCAVSVNKDGLEETFCQPDAVQGSFDAKGMRQASVSSEAPDFSAVLVDGAEYQIENTNIALLSKSDGKEVCDFVGLGSAVGAFDGAVVRIKDCDIRTEGVGKCTIFVDDGSDAVAENCTLTALGGKLYDGYINSADFNRMVAPPWVLGIAGNARGTNLMGDKASTALINCKVTAANWGALSTDNGERNLLTVADSTLTLTGCPEDKKNPYFKTWGSGYGTYILGCHEVFQGVTMNVGTYIGIARDGSADYRSSRGTVRHISPSTGAVLYEGEGKGQNTVLNSDAFGIMAHGWAAIRLTDGTEMNTRNAAFLCRSGGVKLLVDGGAKIKVEDGVLLQVMDDDDATVGVDWDNKEIEMAFHTEFKEPEGWPSENGQISSQMPPRPLPPPPPPAEDGAEDDGPEPPQFDVRFSAADTLLKGDIFNASGYYGQQAKQLYVTLDAGAELTGIITAAEAIHVDENGKQNTYFTSEQYYYLGHVANRPYFNEDNRVEVTLNEGSAWNVTGTGLLSSLTVMPGAVFNGKLTVDGKEIVPEFGKTYNGRLEIAAL